MPYTHHSHSGSYCKHAHDTLDSVVNTAIKKNFKIFCLTEHVPRLDDAYIYPEEKELDMTPNSLMVQFNEYVKHARQLQEKVNNDSNINTKILVGFESEGGINDEHLDMCLKLRKDINAEVIVGSVHHVNGIDIDFDQETWNIAFNKYNGLQGLYKEYFTLVKNMINKLKPEIVAHFDLIRLFANIEIIDDETNKKTKISREQRLNINIENDWPEVWKLINESIDLIIEYDLAVELNSSAIRKGWDTPYPKDDIMKLMISKNVKFVLSDDSHGDDQVGLNYQFVMNYLIKLGVKDVFYYDIEDGKVVKKAVSLNELLNDPFWNINYPDYTF